MPIRVIIFEDSHSLRDSLRQLINGTSGFECVNAYENCLNLLEDVEQDQPDVILMDIQMPGINGIEAVRILRDRYQGIKVLMQTVHEDDEKIFESIYAGASGYILKNTSPGRFMEFIKETHEGGAPFSPAIAKKVLTMVASHSSRKANDFNLSEREKEILKCLVEGMSYKMIADECFISIDTVRSHIKHLYEKLHVHSKGEAIASAFKNRIV